MTIIKGFSTVGRIQKLSGTELLKVDLQNYFSTLKGELDWNPTYGTNIPKLLFENKSDAIKNELYNEIKIGLLSDPRVQSINFIEIKDINKGYNCICEIIESQTMTPVTLFFEFKQK